MEGRGRSAQNGGLDAQNESWKVYRPVFEDSQHFDEEQDSDSDPHHIEVKSRIRIRIGFEMKSLIRISIKIMRIRNTVRNATLILKVPFPAYLMIR